MDEVKKTMVEIPAEKMRKFIAEMKRVKEENAELMGMLSSSVEVIGFMKQNILGGADFSELNISKLIMLVTRLPKILNNLDEKTIAALSQNFDNIKNVAAKHLNEEQLKKIGTTPTQKQIGSNG